MTVLNPFSLRTWWSAQMGPMSSHPPATGKESHSRARDGAASSTETTQERHGRMAKAKTLTSPGVPPLGLDI